jgi:hypothetical protein
MEMIVQPAGKVRCIYSEEIDLGSLGHLAIRRASHVEPAQGGQWIADLSPVEGPLLGPFAKRSGALKAEHIWLLKNWLVSGS